MFEKDVWKMEGYEFKIKGGGLWIKDGLTIKICGFHHVAPTF